MNKKRLIILAGIALVFFVVVISFALQLSDKFGPPDTDTSYVKNLDWTLPIPNQYTDIYRINGVENRFAAMGKVTYNIIDCYGNVIVSDDYHVIEPVSRNGLYLVATDTNPGVNRTPIYLWGFINDNGEKVIELQYGDMKNFVGEHAIGKRANQWHVIDTTGTVLYSNDNELGSTKYANIFRFTDEGVTYLVNIENDETIVFESYDDLPWEAEEIETSPLPPSEYRVEEYHGSYGIVKK